MRKGRFWDSELKEWVADKMGEEMTPEKSKATIFTYDDWLKWGLYGDFVFDELAEDERMRMMGQMELPGLEI
jgi:hypothetical protein